EVCCAVMGQFYTVIAGCGGVVYGDDRIRRIYGGVPSADDPVFGDEEETGRAGFSTFLNDEVGGRIEYRTSRLALSGAPSRRRNGDHQICDRTAAGVDSRDAGALVGDPKGSRGTVTQSPSVDEIGIDRGRGARFVGNQSLEAVRRRMD